MTDFYRFPAIDKLGTLDTLTQLEKIDAEVEEAKSAYYSNDFSYDYGVELIDVIHAVETALRMAFDDEEIDMLWRLVEMKNRKRGYYG